MHKKYIKQHNAIIEARYDISALEKNIIYMLLAQLKDDDPPRKSYYNIDFSELEKRLNQTIPINSLVKAAEALVFRVYTIPKEEGGVLYTSLISSVENLPEHNVIQVGVSSMAKPYLLALKNNYTEFQLDMALRLKSKYAKRMYEMLSQHMEKGTMEVSVEELKYRLALKDPKTGKELYETWSMFEEHVLAVPQKELAQYTDIRFTYTVLKTRRKYTDLVFKITYSNSFQPSFL